jgi:hypothetical protein
VFQGFNPSARLGLGVSSTQINGGIENHLLSCPVERLTVTPPQRHVDAAGNGTAKIPKTNA